tara:strand:- start:139 stop:330 length:192 start_codon:yes stop_codon:yes gene_type:complete
VRLVTVRAKRDEIFDVMVGTIVVFVVDFPRNAFSKFYSAGSAAVILRRSNAGFKRSAKSAHVA